MSYQHNFNAIGRIVQNRDDRFQYPMYMKHWEYNPYLNSTIGMNHGQKSRQEFW